ncbi:MAG: hypothetical protein ACLP19_24025 [Xanthobacteraceae bacterium]
MIDVPDFSIYCRAACVAYWGEPDKMNFKELSWGGRDGYGGRRFHIKKRKWYDAEAKRGGSTLELIALEEGWTDASGKPDTRGKRFFDAWRIGHRKRIIAEAPPESQAPIKAKIREVFPYHDEQGKHVYDVVRFDTKKKEDRFRYRLPNGEWKLGNTKRMLYHLPALIAAVKAGERVLVCEGEKDANTAIALGYTATTNCGGAGEWRAHYDDFLSGADVVIIADNDKSGRGQKHAAEVAGHLRRVAASLRVVMFEQKDLTEWVKAGGDRAALDGRIEQASETQPPLDAAPNSNSYKANGATPPALEPLPIERVLEVFERWLILPSRTPVYAALGTVAANLLPGDPVWLGLIAPPSSSKTELLNSISTLPYVFQAATITPAALLSGVPKKQHHKGAVGGLLRQIGDFGIISLKDFGSVLSMRPDAKAEILAALREIFDGQWTRHLGTEGGRTLSWKGKVGLIFGCTGVIDGHYSVIGAMGDRFLLSRLAPCEGQFRRALQHSGSAMVQMRKELAESVTRLFASGRRQPRSLDEEEFQRLDHVVSLVVKLRGAVERDRQSREIEAIYGAEGTARLGLTLNGLLAGLDSLGVDRDVALDVVESVAMDSVPPLRRSAYEHLWGLACHAETPAVAKALGLPTNTVRRALEELAAYQLVERTIQGAGKPDLWSVFQ